MENLPAELKLQLLNSLNFHTLKSLVRASPTYHAIYRSFRSQVLTASTLRHMVEKKINIDLPSQWKFVVSTTPTGRSGFLWIAVVPEPLSKESLQAAFIDYYDQAKRQVAQGGLIKLSVEHCIALLAVDAMIGLHQKPGQSVRFPNHSGFMTEVRPLRLKWHEMRLMNMDT